jgi:hypothetical protein
LSALGWLLVLDPYWLPGINEHPASASGLIPAPTALNFAFLGAYFFGLQALFRRFVRRDLGPNAYLAFSNRVVLSAIGVWVIVAVFALADSASPSTRSPVASGSSTSVVGSTIVSSDPASGSRAGAASERTGVLVAAFIVGVFPRTLWQVITAALKKISWVKLVVPSVEAKQPLEELDGLTVWHEARLEEEDIENVPNMATADVVDLMLQTQIPAERLVDWVDQAILYKVLGPDSDSESKSTRRSRLRTGGIRTATQLVRVYAMSEGPERSALSALLRSESTNPLPVIVETIQIEANWQLVAAWRGVDFQLSTT